MAYDDENVPQGVPVIKRRKRKQRRIRRDNTGMRKLTIAIERELYRAVVAHTDKTHEVFDLFVEEAAKTVTTEPVPFFDVKFKHYQQKRTEILNVWFSVETFSQLSSAARKRHTTCGAIVREALHTILACNGVEVDYALS